MLIIYFTQINILVTVSPCRLYCHGVLTLVYIYTMFCGKYNSCLYLFIYFVCIV